MKIKNLLLAILATSVSVIAADSVATNQPEGTPPRCEPGMKRKGPPPEIPGVSKEDMKKLREAFMAAKEDPSLKELHDAVKAAREKVKTATNKEDKKAAFEDLKKAHKAFMEAAKEVVLNANPELADTINKVSEFMKNRGPRKCPDYEKKESKEVKDDDDELPPLPPPPAE